MDIFCMTSKFPNLCWNWEKNCPLVHIYYADLWEDNFVRRIYDICDLFLGSMYHMIFKADAPAFSAKAMALIVVHGDWYVGDISLISKFGEAIPSICCLEYFQTEWCYRNLLFKWLLMALIQNWVRTRGRVGLGFLYL